MKQFVWSACVLFVLLLVPGTAIAQTPQADAAEAVVITVAPIYLNPDTTRVPLRTASVGTRLRVLDDAGEWLHVQFQDPEYGPRVGYVEKKNVRISHPEQEPMDLSVRPTPAPASSAGTPDRTAARGTRLPSNGYGMACVGQASTPAFAGFSTSFTTGVRLFNGEVGGSSDHVFGLVGGGYIDFFDDGTHAFDVIGQVGGDVLARSSRIHVCPIVGVAFIRYDALDLTEVDTHAGGSLGIVALDSGKVQVIPFAAAFYTHATLLKQDTSGNFGNATFGVGLTFHRTFSVIPELLLPINVGTSDPTFGVRVALGF